MTAAGARRLAWSVAGACLVTSLVGIGLQIVTWSTFVPLDFGSRDASLALMIAFLALPVVGALVASKRPDSPLGWLFLLIGATISVWALADGYAIFAVLHSPGTLPGGRYAAWVGNWIWIPGWTGLGFVFLLFPDGRLPSTRWRPLAWALGVTGGGFALVLILTEGLLPNYTFIRNPSGLVHLGEDAGATVKAVGIVALLTVGLAVIASLFVRLSRASGEQRQQLKWVAFAAATVVGGLACLSALVALGIRVSWFEAAAPAVAVTIPVSAGVAVLRYRLYDIDVVINKTVVFGALAAFITLVYVAVVVGIGAAVGTRGRPNIGLSILATAIVAVAFQPVRERVQRFANRLVYGERASPYEVLAEFSERMAGAYSSEEILSRMAEIVTEGSGVARADVWLRVGREIRPAATWPETNGVRPDPLPLAGGELPPIPGVDRAFPVRHQGELLGALAVTVPPGESLTPTQAKLLSDLSVQAGLVLRNVRLIAELQASRQRIVAAQDAERRRLERNIHDGAQQQLVALAVKLRLAETMADRSPEKTKELLAQLQAEAGDALENLRDLARGIYPPLLADRGLVAALEAQFRKVALPVELSAEGVARYPQETEAAVYFCCLEALQNVAKYAEASRVVVELRGRDGALEFTVTDDGKGFDPDTTTRGSGLTNMADRLAALGGTLEVSSTPGAGTAVHGRLPVREAAAAG